MTSSPRRSRPRILALTLAFLVCATAAGAQDRFLRTVAVVEAVAPMSLLLVQGIDDTVEAGILGGAIVLHSVPNIILLAAESSRNASLTSLARRISAGAGFATAVGSLGFGAALLLGAFPELGWRPYAAPMMAVSVPALFAALVDLLPYSNEP